jgi:lipid II isoglutaminyl synthase (glutamine-hydrolysing)
LGSLPHVVRLPFPLAAEVAAARAAGRLSRLAGAGGGTTIPGKLLWKLDPGAVDRLAARLPLGSAVLSATNGKTTTAAMTARILDGRVRLAHNSAGANLVSGVASALLDAQGAELGLFEVDEAALSEVTERLRPRAVCLGNLFRDQLDRYGELEHVAARWRAAVRSLPGNAALCVNGDDPQLGDLAREHQGTTVFGVDDPPHARPYLQHAADSKYCLRCGTPYDYSAAYVGHLGDYRCPACGHGRPPLDVAAQDIELHGLESVTFLLVTPEGARRVTLRVPGLYNVYNGLAAASLARSLGASPDEIVSGLADFKAAFGRFERIAVGERTLLMLLIKNPAGANEAVRTIVEGRAPSLAVIALNDAIADGRDVSWIWDVDFEPLIPGLERLIVTGERAAELALRFKYGGLTERAIEVVPSLELALDRGLALTPAGAELLVLPTYTAMLGLRRIVSDRGFVRPYWEPPSDSATHVPKTEVVPPLRSGEDRKRVPE